MTQKILFGTYTKKASKGIYEAILDENKKRLSTPKLFIQLDNPTYLQSNSAGQVFTVAKDKDLGGIASFSGKTAPKLINTQTAAGAPPCYVGLDNEHHLVFAANYHKGTVTVYKVDSDGVLTTVNEVKHTGHGPLPEQDTAKIHFTDLTPDKRLVVCDLGSDKVYTYDISSTGQLSLVATFETAPGFAPRHIVFHPNGKFAYLVGELSSHISTLSYDSHTGKFDLLQTLATIPETFDTAHNGVAAVRISSDGKFVYVSNRGHNTIAAFKVNPDFTLSHSGYTSTEGEFPRDFALDSTEKFLVVTNQNTDNATLFERSSTDGSLTLLQKDIPVPEGVCVSFARFD
ncbi:lactonase family protein [Liquorilactobacillus mali]|uniref:lactonase family protein n=1 Tax=Liquorilactobacillus mali TaxID=1618 RepID=UPI00264E4580|nr:lactonase family protein [Liquorilactobacillus mali]MDN7145330.1 lactonase family protein [Liquorilactobacillus mali]